MGEPPWSDGVWQKLAVSCNRGSAYTLSVSPDELICLKGTADMKKQMRVVSVVALSLVAGLAIAQPEGQRREGRDFGRMS